MMVGAATSQRTATVPAMAPGAARRYLSAARAVCGPMSYVCKHPETEREFFIDNLLVQIHVIIEIFLVDWPCAMGV